MDWQKLGKSAYIVHFTAVLGIFCTLFYLIFNHRSEYYYVWSHSSTTLPFKYLLSCFWEGQEGSFLLWLIWNGVLGSVVIRTSKQWQSPVMAVVSFVQLFLSATILGLYFFDYKLGNSPFALLRIQMANAPIFSRPEYLNLEMVKTGNGLNPLLQNYWMVIHPPILFLGFSSTVVPFAYAIAGLWKKDFTNWVKPTLHWGLFGVAVLGLGIMMGGAWAYESLSFGGYWAWDPVENASLVPWLILVGAVHLLNIYKHTTYSLKTTLVFFMLTFFLVIYSTFLTRTGILGDTSVHAFTGEGDALFYHLVAMMVAIVGVCIYFFIKGNKAIKAPAHEEETWTREFWLYIGSLIFLLSAIQIIFTTSIPVWNKLFNLKLAPPANPMEHYNNVQIWIAIVLGIGTGFVQFLKYKNTNIKEVLQKQLFTIVATAIISITIAYTQHINVWQIIVLLVSVVYALVANAQFLVLHNKLKIPKAGASIAHAGFAILLIGILLSSFNKRVLSVNKLGEKFDLGKATDAENEKESKENIILFRNTPVEMGEYTVTYLGDSIALPNHYYSVQYEKKNFHTNALEEHFVLNPNAQINPKMGLVSSPDSKHYVTSDVFTYITSAIDKSKVVDTVSYTRKTVKVGDSLFFANGAMVYRGMDKAPQNKNYQATSGDIAIGAMLDVYNLSGKIAETTPIYFIRGNAENRVEDTVKKLDLYVRLAKINMDKNNTLDIEYKQPPAQNDYIILKALVFPYINLVWLGTIITVIGTFIALFHRIKHK